MTESIDNLLNKLEEICEYYDCHDKPADATDIRRAIAEYRKEVTDSANVDICDSCVECMCPGDQYPCCSCARAADGCDDHYEYRSNWDENGKYKY